MTPRITLLTAALFINKHYWVIAVLIVIVIGGIMAFPLNYFSNLNVLLGLCLLPFCIRITGEQRINYFFLFFLLCFGILTALYPVKIFYFFAIAFFICLLLEKHLGRINSIALFLIAFMSPFFEQVAGVLGFPIRLHLSTLAGHLLSIAGLPVDVQGNMIVLDGNSFTVDDACMGLNMLSTSLLMGVLMIIYQYKKQQRILSFLQLSGYFLIVFTLNIFCNLLRILMLVLFSIGPEDPLHELAGLVCFAVYAVVPVYFLAKIMVVRYGKPVDEDRRTYGRATLFVKSIMLLIAVGMLWIGINFTERKANLTIAPAPVSFSAHDGVRTDHLVDGVTKLSNDEVLIYLKPIAEFFSGEHTPSFCWKGSGYAFKYIRKNNINGHEIYTGEMVKPEGRLCTAWWYSNGEVQTIDQFDWRLRMMRGEKAFFLVNVTAEDEETLMKYAARVLEVGHQNTAYH
jgi:exosortase N